MGDTQYLSLELNHVELGTQVEWDWNTEQVLGNQATATFIIQDRTNSLYPRPKQDIRASIISTGKNLFRGEVTKVKLLLKTGMSWRRWQVTCVDYTKEFPKRKIGALDGKIWQDVDGLGDYVNIDPFGHSLATDRLTIQFWFDKYIRVDGTAWNTDDFVGEYLTDFGPIFPTYSDLQAELEKMAAYIADNLQFWGDADLAFHWMVLPPWQSDLQGAADVIAGGDDDMTLDFPGVSIERLEQSPVDINLDVVGFQTIGSRVEIGARDIEPEEDGSDMVEQLYVRGATGYVYNAGSVDPLGGTTVINPEGYGFTPRDKFRLTFNATTLLWHKQSNGLISSSTDNASAGGPYDCHIIVVPYNPSNGKGGHFYVLETGPYAGKLVDNDTNYFGYGDIKVEHYVAVTTPPKVGIGGSGWVDEVTQDLNKTQEFFEAPISDTQAIRDSVGGQILYRGQFPTLRGSVTVDNLDHATGEIHDEWEGWRVGQIVKITDSRLPAELNGMSFFIQRVATKQHSETPVREYRIDYGDGPQSRWSAQPKPTSQDFTFPPPAIQIDIQEFDLSPGPNSKQTIVGQLVAKDGTPWEIPGKVVKWSLEAYNAANVLVTEGTLSPGESATDRHGRARTVLTTGPTPGLVYFIFADVTAI